MCLTLRIGNAQPKMKGKSRVICSRVILIDDNTASRDLEPHRICHRPVCIRYWNKMEAVCYHASLAVEGE